MNEQDPLLTEIKYLVTVATDSVSVAIASGQQFIMAIISDQIKQGITFPLSLLHEKTLQTLYTHPMKMTFLFVLLSFITGEIKLVFPELLLNPSINTGSRQRIGVRCIRVISLQKTVFCL